MITFILGFVVGFVAGSLVCRKLLPLLIFCYYIRSEQNDDDA